MSSSFLFLSLCCMAHRLRTVSTQSQHAVSCKNARCGLWCCKMRALEPTRFTGLLEHCIHTQCHARASVPCHSAVCVQHQEGFFNVDGPALTCIPADKALQLEVGICSGMPSTGNARTKIQIRLPRIGFKTRCRGRLLRGNSFLSCVRASWRCGETRFPSADKCTTVRVLTAYCYITPLSQLMCAPPCLTLVAWQQSWGILIKLHWLTHCFI
jgi:hypothetical protein